MVIAMILTMMLIINTLMIFMKHPMSMGMLLISQTIMTSMLSGMIMNMFWMSYILLISMVSGMLVLFMYMSMIASNEKFKNKTFLWGIMILLMMGILFLFLQVKMIIKNNYLSMEMSLFPLSKMFQFENSMITILLVLYLFFTMIVSSHLVNIFEGPMRSKTLYE